VWGADNLLRVEERDEHMLAFRTRYGLCKPTVIQFGTINTPTDIQGYTNHGIREALNDFASTYFDDILIYSVSEEENVGHVKWIIQWLQEAGLYLKPEKCEFHQVIVRYLELVMSTTGISIGSKLYGIRAGKRKS
jgi:hypothetical protein